MGLTEIFSVSHIRDNIQNLTQKILWTVQCYSFDSKYMHFIYIIPISLSYLQLLCHTYVLFYFHYIFVVLVLESRPLQMLGTCLITELHTPNPKSGSLVRCLKKGPASKQVGWVHTMIWKQTDTLPSLNMFTLGYRGRKELPEHF